MGTQQLLLIVLGVIIVGIAIAVGITIFNNQAYNNNRQAVATELNTYGTNAMQWWKTPTAQGGAGRVLPTAHADDIIANYLGFTETGNKITTDTGTFQVVSTATADTSVAIQGIGTERRSGKLVSLDATAYLGRGKIEIVPTPEAGE